LEISSGDVFSASKRTRARPVARFTSHASTPATCRAAFSTCDTQLAQLIPATSSVASVVAAVS
jgi:hypothetical protein